MFKKIERIKNCNYESRFVGFKDINKFFEDIDTNKYW